MHSRRIDVGMRARGGNTDTPTAEPVMEWEANPDFAVTPLEQVMDVNIIVKAEAGIKGFVVKVESDVLSPIISAVNDGSSDMNLVSPSDGLEGILSAVNIPLKDKVLNQKELNFNISELVPMIITVGGDNLKDNSDHKFTLILTDNEDRTLSREIVFHYSKEPSISVKAADLWANTAVLDVFVPSSVSGVKIYYKESDAANWIEIKAEDGVYTAAPTWIESKNAANLKVYRPETGTGIFAGNSYIFELRNSENTEVLASCSYTAPDGDVIPNGDMSGWSFKTMTMSDTDYKITYPNLDGESFWDSGNNMFLEQYNEDGSVNTFTPLCMEDDGTAILSARMVLTFVFAPGNMYTGDFNYSGMSGTASFGKKYNWTARPKGMKVSYKASVGLIDKEGSNDPEKGQWKDKQDVSRIYAVVIDWTKQHGVTSGMAVPTGMWDPATMTSVEEGAIIGYASFEITSSSDKFNTVAMPFEWYDTAVKPADGNYSLVISCATSNRGDYLTGCSTNELYVDDFEWVY